MVRNKSYIIRYMVHMCWWLLRRNIRLGMWSNMFHHVNRFRLGNQYNQLGVLLDIHHIHHHMVHNLDILGRLILDIRSNTIRYSNSMVLDRWHSQILEHRYKCHKYCHKVHKFLCQCFHNSYLGMDRHILLHVRI